MVAFEQQHIEGVCHVEELLFCNLLRPPEFFYYRSFQLIFEALTLLDCLLYTLQPFILFVNGKRFEFEFTVETLHIDLEHKFLGLLDWATVKVEI